jgi:hypothetical protein
MKSSDTLLSTLLFARVMAVIAGAIVLVPSDRTLAHDGASDNHQGAHSSAKPATADTEIVVQEGGHPILKGPQTHGQVLTLVAGEPIVLALRNEDRGPREFISPLFTKTEIHFLGRATGIFRKDAAGFRLNPGDTLTLQFTAPFSGFHRMYDLIWCGHDGKPGTEIQELLIIMTEEKQPHAANETHGR